jgi:hypothetical protein
MRVMRCETIGDFKKAMIQNFSLKISMVKALKDFKEDMKKPALEGNRDNGNSGI